MRIGVFGGTFDPLHIGHLVAAQNAQYAAALDRVLFVVANVPWQKEAAREVTDPALRLAVVRAVIETIDGFEASDLEIRRGGRSYTVDTLRELRAQHPNDELFLIVGSDAANQMRTWERADELPLLSRIVVVNRYGYPSPTVLEGFRDPIFAEMPWLDISSTDLRERVRDRRPLQFLLPDEAIAAINRFGLYHDAPPPHSAIQPKPG
ncbi:nicotinate (nicotinamide) nucleotide adenylyltransferase [Acidimicrobium ferrooxidans DSM 10331]|uniref:Probable nicotinate-nucleotide adenylyltransferase n=1 Tax=Acidimicrobium ferrooxidans (strain DSM 10331 / JCM 15462 / NBRC 103882 / ICP) TaxID=525909 RepID=C7LYD0_ACIFD|nr:nicotinate-nucleotide adenylyltransferase [Acidimicrobium ferrooxidans]ACU53738.1 nicotinate (nicotinamide) nucleotide adenylyltransferase [Acidimicrobium ferrooxidans DSM 10331]